MVDQLIAQKKIKNTWYGIKQRCLNPNSHAYKYYSRVGVYDRWLTFSNFRDDMLEAMVDHIDEHGLAETTIDRINNDLGYCKENCRWATWDVQRKNKRDKLVLTEEEKKRLDKEWNEIMAIPVYTRIGMSKEEFDQMELEDLVYSLITK